MALLVALIFLCGAIGMIIVMLAGKLGGIEFSSEQDLKELLKSSERNGFVKFIIGINHILVFTVAPILYILSVYPQKIKKYLGFPGYGITLLLLCILLLYVSYPLMGYLAQVTEYIVWPDWLQSMDRQSIEQLAGVLRMDNYTDLAINLLIVAIFPGIGEELLFRGIIQNEMLNKTGKPLLAIVLTSAIFSAFHFQLSGFFPKFLIGCILGYSYYIAKDIRLPMLLHIFNNAMATLAFFIAGADISTFEERGSEKISHIVALISFFSAILIGWFIFTKYKSPFHEQESGA